MSIEKISFHTSLLDSICFKFLVVKYRLNFAIFFSASWAALRAKGATWVKDFLSLRALHSRELFTHRWTLCPPCSHENSFAVGCGWELTTVGENWEPPGIWTMCVLAFLFFQAGGVAPPCFPAARRWIILYTLNWRKFKDLLVPSAYTSSCLHQFKNLQFRIALKLSGHLWIIIVLVCVMVLSSRKSLLAKTSSKCLMHTEVAAAAFKRPPPPPPPCQGSSQQGFHFVHHHHLPGCISIVRGRITAPRHWKDSSKHIIWEESTAWIYIFLVSLRAQLILNSAIQMLMKKK